MSRDTFDMFSGSERGRFGDNEASPKRQRVTGASDLVDVTVLLHAESKKGLKDQGAIRVSNDGDDDKAQWLPKSQVELADLSQRNCNAPAWPANVVRAVDETGKDGSVTITLKVKAAKHGGPEKTLICEVKAKKPIAEIAPAVFFSNEEGDLHRFDPRQEEMTLGEVSTDKPVMDAGRFGGTA